MLLPFHRWDSGRARKWKDFSQMEQLDGSKIKAYPWSLMSTRLQTPERKFEIGNVNANLPPIYGWVKHKKGDMETGWWIVGKENNLNSVDIIFSRIIPPVWGTVSQRNQTPFPGAISPLRSNLANTGKWVGLQDAPQTPRQHSRAHPWGVIADSEARRRAPSGSSFQQLLLPAFPRVTSTTYRPPASQWLGPAPARNAHAPRLLPCSSPPSGFSRQPPGCGLNLAIKAYCLAGLRLADGSGRPWP